MAIRQVELTPEAEPILKSVAALYGGDENRALSELLITRESVDSFLDEIEGANAQELLHRRDSSIRDFEKGNTISWEQVKAKNAL